MFLDCIGCCCCCYTYGSSSFHVPPSCDPGRGVANPQPDCVDTGCSATNCTYRLALTRVPGSSLGCVRTVAPCFFSLTRRSYFISFTTAQGIPKC